MNICTENGQEATPLKMICEHRKCDSTDVLDYKRKTLIKGWEDEPIALCKKHSEGYEPFLYNNLDN